MQWVDEFKAMYQQLNATNLDLLDLFYHQDASFTDPFHRLNGLAEIKAYFQKLYENVEAISFQYDWQIIEQHQAVIGWQMTYQHPNIKKGSPISLPGVSRIEFSKQRITSHVDYFDGGAMLYEHLPVVGSAVRYVKRKVQGNP